MVCLLYFNPRSPWGERRARQSNTRFAAAFQSTLPVGGATRSFLPLFLRVIYFNPRSPWGERRHLGVDQAHFLRISIHAPRGGSDGVLQDVVVDDDISIHAPRGGSDLGMSSQPSSSQPFQSTLPVGGATSRCNPFGVKPRISIHAPRGGSDMTTSPAVFRPLNFNPRSPWGERPLP